MRLSGLRLRTFLYALLILEGAYVLLARGRPEANAHPALRPKYGEGGEDWF